MVGGVGCGEMKKARGLRLSPMHYVGWRKKVGTFSSNTGVIVLTSL